MWGMKVEMIRSWEIKSLYAFAAQVGLVDKASDQDDLHIIVERMTGKTSIKKLTRAEYFKVHNEIRNLFEKAGKDHRADTEIIDKAWALMYELIRLTGGSKSDAGKRMCGAIKKICKVDAHPHNPFRFVKERDVHKLIEQLKRYVDSARQVASKKEGEVGAVG